MKRLRLRGGAFVGHPVKQERPQSKGSVAKKTSGNSGNKHRKAHLRAQQPPCWPQGVGYGTARCQGKGNRP